MITPEELPDYISAAEQGDTEAQFKLARYYDMGFRLGFDFPEIENTDADIYWYLKASEAGHAEAQYHLAMHYKRGLGVKQDIKKSQYWFVKSAEQGYEKALSKIKVENNTMYRKLPDESELILKGYNSAALVRRRQVLKETLNAFLNARPANKYQLLAQANLKRWQKGAIPVSQNKKIQIILGDWGEVTLALTKKYGQCFAVLNMANAWIPGGGYMEGMAAQEENIFRRTDCHFFVTSKEYDAVHEQYTYAMTELLTGKYGVVYLDKECPRTCIRGPENRALADLGYKWLAEDEIFPFYELRASAQDLRGGKPFNEKETRKRIKAQLNTLSLTGTRYAVLGAFGCGAFQNPPVEVARIYKEEINRRSEDFDLIAFAILNSERGKNNYQAFNTVFSELP